MQSLQPEPILQSRLMDPPWALRGGMRLPGTGPIAGDDWIRRDQAFAGQMALRDRLIDARLNEVHALRAEALAPARELLAMVLDILRGDAGYRVGADEVTRPDGVVVRLDTDAPLLTLGRLVQEDFCLLQHRGDEHVMTGAILCFPASWSLAEKMDRPLTGIHRPVDSYDGNIARRVQRMFDAIRPGMSIMRANCLLYSDFHLFQPRSEMDRRVKPSGAPPFVRTERQCLLRLPASGAVVFTIHTTVARVADLSEGDRADLKNYLYTHTDA